MRFQLNRFIKSFGYGFKGIQKAFKTEQNLVIHFVIVIVVVLTGIYLNISTISWGLITFSIFFVVSSELMNTSIEKLSDIVSEGEANQKIAAVKDIAAGAVLMAAINALIIGFLFLLIPLYYKFFGPR